MATPPDDKPPERARDADDWWPAGKPRETLIDRQIRQAIDEGAFTDLPYQGEPLPNDENPYAAEWGLAFHMLKNAGFAPPWIEADKEVRVLLERIDAIIARAEALPPPSALARRRAHAQIESFVQQVNAAIERVNAEAPSPRQHRRPVVLAEALRRYDEATARQLGGGA